MTSRYHFMPARALLRDVADGIRDRAGALAGIPYSAIRRGIEDVLSFFDEPPSTFEPLQEATVVVVAEQIDKIVETTGVPREVAEADARRANQETKHYRNSIYQADVIEAGEMVMISVKRRDQRAIRDWRDLQEIKNQIVGPECEAVELYPAESRLVDDANTFWLWACKDPTYRFPLGFDTGRRQVGTPEQAAAIGAVQRARGEPTSAPVGEGAPDGQPADASAPAAAPVIPEAGS